MAMKLAGSYAKGSKPCTSKDRESPSLPQHSEQPMAAILSTKM